MLIVLPFPPAVLNPNRSRNVHFGKLYPIKKAAKETGRIAAMMVPRWADPNHVGNFSVSILFFEPDARCRDLDNLHASCKDYIDGICIALGINDKRLRPVMLNAAIDRSQPRVEIEIEPIRN